MKPIVTFAKGSEAFGIKPYRVLVIGYERSKLGQVLELILYDKFDKKPDGTYILNPEGRYRFNPNDVVLSNELQDEFKADGVTLPEYAFKTCAKAVILRRRVGSMESECPGFQKYWEQEVEECKACAKVFQDEYAMCRKLCLEKRADRAEQAQSIQSIPQIEKSVTPPVLQEFKGFREGTRADVLLKFLQLKGECTCEEAAKHIASVMTINDRVALANVKGYAWEWAKGKWNNQSQNFPFTVVIQGETIKYQTK